jgi:predicted CoA-binding protein
MTSKVCEIPTENATNEEMERILSTAKVIAVVGLSDKPERDSYRVASYLKEQGYHVIPINPFITESLGVKSYPSLKDAPAKIDVVDIFRQPDAVPEIVDEAIEAGAKVIWMQENIVHNASAEKARAHKLHVVMDKCIMKEHKKAFQTSQESD